MRKLLLVLPAFMLVVLPGCGTTTTDGSHVGIVTAVENNGLIWKTTDVYVKSDATASSEDVYCATDRDVVAVLRKANIEGKKVELKYHSELVVAPWRCTGNDIIDDVVSL